MALRKPLNVALLAAFALAFLAPRCPAEEAGFSEVWAYLMAGEEQYLDPSFPITDVCYFCVGISSEGKLGGVPDRARIAAFPGRVHLVVAEVGNYALTNFCLDPEYPLRDRLVMDIAKAAESYDGVQIDFEAVNSASADRFFYFLCLLKQCLGGKLLSVALPARLDASQDRLGYERIGQVADRVVIMAYDEHWSTSEPGPVASLEWCGKAAAYASSQVGAEKLVMGLPFYGRAWADKALSRAYKFPALRDILAEKGIEEVSRLDDIPFVEYSESVNVKLFFDDAASIAARLGVYRAASVRNVSFWRLGQEDPAVWGRLAPGPAEALPSEAPDATPPEAAAEAPSAMEDPFEPLETPPEAPPAAP